VRWFIVFLIVANVILFFWVQQQSRPLPGLATLPSPDIGRLRLLSEVDEEKARDDAGAESSTVGEEPPTAEAEPVALAEAPAAETGLDIPLEPPVAEVTVTPEPVQELSQGPGDDDAESAAGTAMLPEAGEPPAEQPVQTDMVIPEVAEQPASESAAPPAGGPPEETAEPLAEDAQEEAAQLVAQAQAPAADTAVPELQAPPPPAEQEEAESVSDAVPPAAEAEPAVCVRVGPFESDQADSLIAGLPASVSLLSDTNEDASIVDRYYVLVPALPSRAEGRKKLKELTDAGVTDTWLFPSGEFRNAISLGFFSREAGANRHAANIAKKGFTTEVKGRTYIRKRRWLLLKRADGSDPASGLVLPAAAASVRQDCP